MRNLAVIVLAGSLNLIIKHSFSYHLSSPIPPITIIPYIIVIFVFLYLNTAISHPFFELNTMILPQIPKTPAFTPE